MFILNKFAAALAMDGCQNSKDSRFAIADCQNRFFLAGIEGRKYFSPVRGNLNWGYGHPSLMFLYPLTGYVGSLLSLAGLSFTAAALSLISFAMLGVLIHHKNMKA